VLPLEPAQTLELDDQLWIRLDLGAPTDLSFPVLLAPPREHERVHIQGLGDIFDLDAGDPTQLFGVRFELIPVA